MKKRAIILAAGNGSRMNAELPKQFLSLNGKPVLFYTMRTFLQSFPDMEIILVLPEGYVGMGQEIIDGYFDEERIVLCAGGENRFQSVKNGIARLDDEDSIVFVHDGVRCLLTTDLIHRCYESALLNQTAIPVVYPKDSIRAVEEEGGSHAEDREKFRLVQTPQTFHSTILKSAFDIDHKSHFTDEASVVEAFGLNLHLIEGEENNFKITTPLDLILAEGFFKFCGH